MIDIIALEKPLDEALSREELCIMLSKLEENFYPFEVEGEFSAIFGLIRSATADEIMNYDLSPLKKLLADMMNDMQKEQIGLSSQNINGKQVYLLYLRNIKDIGIAYEDVLAHDLGVKVSDIIKPYITENIKMRSQIERNCEKIKELTDQLYQTQEERDEAILNHEDSELKRDIPLSPYYKITTFSNGQKDTMWFCPNCRSRVSNWEPYCNKCGQHLGKRDYDEKYKITEL